MLSFLSILALLCASCLSLSTVSAFGPLLPTVTWGDTTSAVFTAFSSEYINAPPELVYEIVTDFKGYHEWNTFVVNVSYEGELMVGTKMNFSDALIFPGLTYTSAETFTVWNKTALLTAWSYGSPSSGLYSEHVTQISYFAPNVSLYISWETFYGVGAVAVEAAVGLQTQNAFVVEGKDLKKYAESLAASS